MNDMLRKRKADPIGWQPGEPTYVRRLRQPLRLVVELVLVRVVHGDHSVGHPSLVDVVEWSIPCPLHPQNDDNDTRL